MNVKVLGLRSTPKLCGPSPNNEHYSIVCQRSNLQKLVVPFLLKLSSSADNMILDWVHLYFFTVLHCGLHLPED